MKSKSKSSTKPEVPSIRTADGAFTIQAVDEALMLHLAAALANPASVLVPSFPAIPADGDGAKPHYLYGQILIWVEELRRTITLSAPEPVLLRFAAMIGQAKARGDQVSLEMLMKAFPDQPAGDSKPWRNAHLSIRDFDGAVHGVASTLVALMIGVVNGTVSPNANGTVTLTTGPGILLRGLSIGSVLQYLWTQGKLKRDPSLVHAPKAIEGAPGLAVRLNGQKNQIELVAAAERNNPEAHAFAYVALDHQVPPNLRELAKLMVAQFNLSPEVHAVVFGTNGHTPAANLQIVAAPVEETVASASAAEPEPEPVAAEETPSKASAGKKDKDDKKKKK